jgi:hypothetical protein
MNGCLICLLASLSVCIVVVGGGQQPSIAG